MIFFIFFLHNVSQIQSSRRLYGFESHVTSIDGLISVDVKSPPPAPSVVQPVIGVADKIGVLVPSRILSESPMEFFPAALESPPAGSPNVLVIVICSVVLAGILIALTWYICVKRKRECCERVQSSRKDASFTHGGSSLENKPAYGSSENGRGPGPSIVDRRSMPTLPPDQPVAKGRGGGEPKPSHHPAPPMAIARGHGGSKPSDPPAQPMMNERGGGGSKPTHPPVPPIAKGRGGGGSKPTDLPGPSIANGHGGGRAKPTNVPAPPVANGNGGESSFPPVAKRQNGSASRRSSLEPRVQAGPSRVAEFGLILFSYEDLRISTDDFSATNFLGEGGFAKVYKGTLSNGRKVAVKVLRNENSKAEKEFRNEVDIISRARHRNIVSLVGYCITETKRVIVYEFVENKSLYDHLRGGKDIEFMDWPIRMKIARGSSKGLAYLHEECPQKIIHRDVKPANILLDSKFVPKVADFGIAKLCPDHFDSLIATYAIGSIGFIDPAYVATRELSFKSDVYSFGVVLLELISGHINLAIVHGLKNKLSRALRSGNFDGIADERLNLSYDHDEMIRVVSCAEACLRKEPKDRPQMSQISQVLENVISPTELRIRARPERGV